MSSQADPSLQPGSRPVDEHTPQSVRKSRLGSVGNLSFFEEIFGGCIEDRSGSWRAEGQSERLPERPMNAPSSSLGLNILCRYSTHIPRNDMEPNTIQRIIVIARLHPFTSLETFNISSYPSQLSPVFPVSQISHSIPAFWWSVFLEEKTDSKREFIEDYSDS